MAATRRAPSTSRVNRYQQRRQEQSITNTHRRSTPVQGRMFRAMCLLLSSSAKQNRAAVAGRQGEARRRRRVASSSRFVVRQYLSSTSSTSQRLAGKVAVITGAASGIGRVTAAEFIRNGAKIVLADVQDELGAAAAAELGPYASYTRCDVTDEAQVAAAVDLAVARHGRLDVVYNNAGVTGAISSADSTVESLDLADFDRVLGVNLRGVAAGIKHAARVMVPRREGGCILCTASTEAVLGGSGLHAYSVSKAAIVGMVRSVAGELARHGVRVNAISPYAIATPMATQWVRDTMPGASDEDVRRMFEVDFNEMDGVVLRAEDIAKAAVFLASDDGQYVNGHNLVVDGGFTVGKRLNVPAR